MQQDSIHTGKYMCYVHAVDGDADYWPESPYLLYQCQQVSQHSGTGTDTIS